MTIVINPYQSPEEVAGDPVDPAEFTLLQWGLFVVNFTAALLLILGVLIVLPQSDVPSDSKSGIVLLCPLGWYAYGEWSAWHYRIRKREKLLGIANLVGSMFVLMASMGIGALLTDAGSEASYYRAPIWGMMIGGAVCGYLLFCGMYRLNGRHSDR
ncbi:hypothetical protein [Aeoliella mucimassa]|uniref:Uncharacterized protein n=1 Tax=Aeoliella mucimassa TaxID=2527972 RepID=A0A518AMQ5_9BACT|nr:hypothetical protein [Aeoliella mucimassa]QDU56014.1 hypothetical protein Pan181_22160 [Aeoliella mucimassa]